MGAKDQILGAQDQQDHLELIFSLLKQTTSLDVVSEFLKSKGATYSASSWDQMYEKRIQPALESHKISETDLLGLLREAEECGHQHVFLYQTDSSIAIELIDRTRIITELAKQKDLLKLLISPQILDQPSEPTIVDIRWSSSTTQVDLDLIVKIIETRVVQRFLGESRDGNFITKNYEQAKERAVNLIRLHRHGLLEIRLGSHSNSSNYRTDLARIWKRLAFLIEESAFSPISLFPAKNKLWTERSTLAETIRYSGSTFMNDYGNSIKAASGSVDSDLFSDKGVVSSFDAFIQHDAYCDSSNIWFKVQEHGPSKEIHVLLTGELNEFAVTANCTPVDYEHVLAKIRSLNI